MFRPTLLANYVRWLWKQFAVATNCPGGGGGHFHTWEYWGCAAGQGAFLSFQLFELPELGQGPFLGFELPTLGTHLACILLIFQAIISQIPSHFLA